MINLYKSELIFLNHFFKACLSLVGYLLQETQPLKPLTKKSRKEEVQMEKEAKRREREAMRLKKAAEKAEAKAQREAERTSKRAMKPGECMKVSNIRSLYTDLYFLGQYILQKI